MPAKIPALGAGADAEASREKRGACGREEEDGREEGAAAPLEALQALLPVVLDRVAYGGCPQSCPNKSANEEARAGRSSHFICTNNRLQHAQHRTTFWKSVV